MQVTQENLNAQLPIIEQSIKSADFIAFDTEFTGIWLF